MTENRDVLSRAAMPPDHTLRYGDHADAIADVWFAVDLAAPVVMLWHGGFWRVAFDRTHLRPMANAVRDEGFTVVMPEYRRTGGDGDGGWPGTFDDVARASDVLPGMVAAETGAASPVIHAGHSAGGHLAVWAARRHLLPVSASWRRATPPPIAAVVALAPVLDLAEAFRLDLDDGAVHALLGGGPETVAARYDATDPMRIGGTTPTVAIVHGDTDGRVPVALSRQFAARGFGSLEEVAGADHFAVIDPESGAWPMVVRALRA